MVYFAVSTRDEAAPIGGLAAVNALHYRHGCRAGLHPNKLPVVVKVVCEKLARLKSGVPKRALCLHVCRHQQRNQHQCQLYLLHLVRCFMCGALPLGFASRVIYMEKGLLILPPLSRFMMCLRPVSCMRRVAICSSGRSVLGLRAKAFTLIRAVGVCPIPVHVPYFGVLCSCLCRAFAW